MPSFDSIVVGEDWISEHFFTTDSTKESFQAEVVKLRKSWDEDAKAGHSTTLTRFSECRGQLQILLSGLSEDASGASDAYGLLRSALGFPGTTAEVAFERSGTDMVVPGVWAAAGNDFMIVEAEPADAAEDVLSTVAPLGTVLVDGKPAKPENSVAKAVSEMYLSANPPKYVLILAGRWVVLTEQERWAEGRYLVADALLVADRNDAKKYAETDRFLAIFGRDSLMPSPDGVMWWDEVLAASLKHTIGVSKDLREGIRKSIEIIANDVLKRRSATGLSTDQVDGQDLARQSLRFLYRILFLLYAEASPEMGVLPIGAGEYNEGYGLDRLRELTLVNLASSEAQRGTHIYESLALLFNLVNKGHIPGPGESNDPSGKNEGLTFRSLEADLFQPSATALINDAKLSNGELQQVLQHLLLSKESRGKDRGFISYAELGINQLGAVYEGLMSYTGFIAETDLYEVAKDGNSEKGSWIVPVDRSESIEAKHFVQEADPLTGEKKPVVHSRGSFVFRLAGRERQQSASYYTPEVLTKFVVSQALEELLDQNDSMTAADEILQLSVCEPALGSGAFAIEAVRQLADEYLKRKQAELDVQIPADEYPLELQKVKAQIALHQVHGVDLNSTAVELAEVSLWLDTMVKDLQAPWFGLRLRRGNSLIGARRATYSRASINDKTWLKSAPQDASLTGLVAAMNAEQEDAAVVGRVHHFLLPADGWGAASDAKEVKDLAGDAQKTLKTWRNSVKNKPSKAQVDRLVNLGRRVESLWAISLRRLQVAEQEARRDIDYFGKPLFETVPVVDTVETDSLPSKPVTRAQIEATLNDENGAYQRLRRVMDAWNALWFWPLTERATLGFVPPTMEQWLDALEMVLGRVGKESKMQGQQTLAAGANWDELNEAEYADIQLSLASDIDTVKTTHPWLTVCENIAGDQGFFHWELDFASTFGRGGFDLQVGNPPWVRPRADDAALLAEGDPWWQLTEKPTQAMIRAKREETLAQPGMLQFFAENAITNPVVSTFLGEQATYPLLSGLQPDLYRAFMARTWTSSSPMGVVALLHPESHFTEKKAAHLRAETYRRLRRHWQFINELVLFEIDHHVTYGVHVYGQRREQPHFKMAASLYHPDTVVRSEKHDGSGEVPGLKDGEGKWDTRPHAERIIDVDEALLAVWADILDEPGTPPVQARMVYPVNSSSSNILSQLSKAERIADLNPDFSTGWHETNARRDGYFEVGFEVAKVWSEVIIQGPHFTNLNPYAKSPNPTMKNNLDWIDIDLEAVGSNLIPSTAYQIEGDPGRFKNSFGFWGSGSTLRLTSDEYRIFWREYVGSVTGRRTLQAAIYPPGTTHINSVNSLGLFQDNYTLLIIAGFLNSLLLDYWVRVSGSSHIYAATVGRLPFPSDNRLSAEIAQRVFRLNLLSTTDFHFNYKQDQNLNIENLNHLMDLGRQHVLAEIDVLVALHFKVSLDALCALYRLQFPVQVNYDKNDLYDVNGRKVPGEINKAYRKLGESLSVEDRTWTHPESGMEYVFEFPFKGFDREEDMRTAYAHFEKMLESEKS